MSDAPKPGSWIKKPEPVVQPKRPYILRPHLMTRPLSGNAELTELRQSITQKGNKK
jgi:hypothetical protein